MSAANVLLVLFICCITKVWSKRIVPSAWIIICQKICLYINSGEIMTLGHLHVNQHKNIIVSDKNPTVQKCIIRLILVIISLIYFQVYLWADKYRPRKPRFFNRVHTVCFSLFWLCQQVLIAYYTIFSDKLHCSSKSIPCLPCP